MFFSQTSAFSQLSLPLPPSTTSTPSPPPLVGFHVTYAWPLLVPFFQRTARSAAYPNYWKRYRGFPYVPPLFFCFFRGTRPSSFSFSFQISPPSLFFLRLMTYRPPWIDVSTPDPLPLCRRPYRFTPFPILLQKPRHLLRGLCVPAKFFLVPFSPHGATPKGALGLLLGDSSPGMLSPLLF